MPSGCENCDRCVPTQCEGTGIICPECRSESVIPVIYGMPAALTFAAEQEGRLRLGGIMMSEDSPDWSCTACGHEWPDPDCKRRLFREHAGNGGGT